MDISFSVQAQPTSMSSWLDLARRAERDGYRRLYCADHPGSTVSPVPALAAVAAVTSSIGLGALVMNVGVHEPFDIATDIASLDLLSGGRAVLGLGAGHTPVEWAQVGRAYPSPFDRVGRFLEVVDVVRQLLAGDPVRFDGKYVQVDAADGLSVPAHGEIGLLLGGNGRRLLTHAAEHADIISISGLGRTLSDGHRHEIAWLPEQIDERLALIASAVPTGRRPVLEALVQHVQVTDDAEAAVAAWAPELARNPGALVEAPFLLVGTVGEIAARIRKTARDRGITAYTIRASAMDDVALVSTELAR